MSAHPGFNVKGNSGCVKSSTYPGNVFPRTAVLECKKDCHNVTQVVTVIVKKKIVLACTKTSLQETSTFKGNAVIGKINRVCKQGFKPHKMNVTVYEEHGDYWVPIEREVLIECKKD